MAQCYVERDRSGINRLAPVYRMYRQAAVISVSAKRRHRNRTTIFGCHTKALAQRFDDGRANEQ